MPDVLTAGELLGVVRADGPVRLGPSARLSVAGAEATVAIGLARLGHGSGWVGVLGRDGFGDLALRTLRAEGVDVSAVRRDDAPTGVLVSEERLAGVVRVDHHRRGSAGSLLAPADLLAALDPAPRVLHLSGITPALGPAPAAAVRQGAAAARAAGALVCLDVNHRPRLWDREQARAALAPLVPLLDVVVASEDELDLVGGGPGPLLDAGVREVVVTRGAGGATATTAAGAVHVAARPVRVVNPVGAGDAFVAGWLSALLDGLGAEERLDRGAAVGAFCVASAGDWEGLPRRDELALLDLGSGAVVR